MKTIKLKLYQFGELDDKAKEKAIEKRRYINVETDWWEFAYEEFIALGNTIGLDIAEKTIYFRGFYSQGDGSAFRAEIDLKELWQGIQMERWKQEPVALELLKLTLPDIDRRVIRLIRNEKLDVTARVHQPYHNSYYVKAEVTEHLSYNNGHRYPRIESELEKLEKGLQNIADSLNRYFFQMLQMEYENLTSDDAVAREIKCSEYWFTADGEEADRIDDLAEEPILN